ncbi:LUC7-domain-containing protein, partial [Ramicandelaber brevisporus]
NFQRRQINALFAQLIQADSKNYHYSDPEVCKHLLVELCPFELFTHTKSDLGECQFKVHSTQLQEDYRKSRNYGKLGYEREFYAVLDSIIQNLDRRIAKQRARLNLTPDEQVLRPHKDIHAEKVIKLELRLQDLIDEAQKAGESGDIDLAERLTSEIEQLRDKMTEMKRVLNEDEDIMTTAATLNPLLRQEQKMNICGVCGAYIHSNDSETRKISHLEGKQHLGFLKIRQLL